LFKKEIIKNILNLTLNKAEVRKNDRICDYKENRAHQERAIEAAEVLHQLVEYFRWTRIS